MYVHDADSFSCVELSEWQQRCTVRAVGHLTGTIATQVFISAFDHPLIIAGQVHPNQLSVRHASAMQRNNAKHFVGAMHS